MRYILLTLLSLGMALPAAAQTGVQPLTPPTYQPGPYGYGPNPRPYDLRGYGYDPGYHYDYYGGTSSVGDMRRGAADILRGAGEYNRDTAAAAYTLEQAEDIALDNWVEGVRAYWDRKAIWEQNAELRGTTAPDPSTIARLNDYARPDRLSETAYRDDGGLNWPEPLMTAGLAPQRRQVEQLISDRSVENSGPSSAAYADLERVTGLMKADLKNRIESVDPEAYMSASNFLDSLAYEGRFASETDLKPND